MTLHIIGAIIAAIGALTGLAAIAQKERADKRKEWFTLPMGNHPHTQRQLGTHHLAMLARSPLATPSERSIITHHAPRRKLRTPRHAHRRTPHPAHR